MNRFLRIGPKTFASGFPGLVCLFENPTTPSLARHNTSERHILTLGTAFLSSLSLFLVNGRSFSAFCLVVRQPYDAGTNTYPLPYIPIRFYRIDIREDANTHKAIACKYISSSIYTVVEEVCQLILLVLDTLRPRVIDGSESVAAFGFGFCWVARSLLSCQKLHWFPFEHWHFLSTDNQYLFLLQRHFISFDS